MNIAIITARGGSKRIPKKNIREFCGKPIIAYSIEAALQSGIFDEVMVSTDSEEIAEIARQYGANVPFLRSEETSNDYATTADVLHEVVECYKERGQQFDYMCCIYPTAPFVTADKLIHAMEIMEKERSMEVMPVVAFSYPPQRAYVVCENGRIQYEHEEYARMRSQDLQTLYHDAGQFYLYDVYKYMENERAGHSDVVPIYVSELEVQDIDHEDDWKLAEVKYHFMKEHI